MGENANTNVVHNVRDNMNREQFIDGLYEPEIQKLLRASTAGRSRNFQ